MKPPLLDAAVAREVARAQAGCRLDEVLGRHHGLSWADFVLLWQLDSEVAGVAQAPLARRLGLSRARLLMRLRPLEKLGWLRCLAQPVATAQLSPSGRRLLGEARETAAALCARLHDEHQAAGLPTMP